jgi:hypothetical protein
MAYRLVNQPDEGCRETWPATAASVDSATVSCGRTHPRWVTPRQVGCGFMGIAGSKWCIGHGR